MGGFFAPLDYTDLNRVIPKKDKIFSSLMCGIGNTGTQKESQNELTHVILTFSGIAYQKPENTFCYWYSHPEHKISFWKFGIDIDGFAIHVNKDLNEIYSLYTDDIFETIKNYFSDCCKMLSNTFQEFIESLIKYAYDGELINQSIAKIGLDNFLELVHILYNAGFKKETLMIVENTIKIIPKKERKKLNFYKRLM
ncbi:MAG: hypothetical protein EU529_17180 [Promethearchaeota archaeon]|nr:MAG: hypothetical protein EU529_17180 [Candidatus Lokiarchaeota archaeon]